MTSYTAAEERELAKSFGQRVMKAAWARTNLHSLKMCGEILSVRSDQAGVGGVCMSVSTRAAEDSYENGYFCDDYFRSNDRQALEWIAAHRDIMRDTALAETCAGQVSSLYEGSTTVPSESVGNAQVQVLLGPQEPYRWGGYQRLYEIFIRSAGSSEPSATEPEAEADIAASELATSKSETQGTTVHTLPDASITKTERATSRSNEAASEANAFKSSSMLTMKGE